MAQRISLPAADFQNLVGLIREGIYPKHSFGMIIDVLNQAQQNAEAIEDKPKEAPVAPAQEAEVKPRRSRQSNKVEIPLTPVERPAAQEEKEEEASDENLPF